MDSCLTIFGFYILSYFFQIQHSHVFWFWSQILWPWGTALTTKHWSNKIKPFMKTAWKCLISDQIYPDLQHSFHILWSIEQTHKGCLLAEPLNSSLHLQQLEWNKLNCVVTIKKRNLLLTFSQPFHSQCSVSTNVSGAVCITQLKLHELVKLA